MTKKEYIAGIIVFALGISFAFGAREMMDRAGIKKAEQNAREAFKAGDYAASLKQYAALEQNAEESEFKEKTEESADFLVTKELYQKAKKAAEVGDWLKVKALLNESGAVKDTSFKFYEDAIDLYLSASEKVKVLEKKIENELQQFKQQAADEKLRRQRVETEITQTEETLKEVINEKEKTEQELAIKEDEVKKVKEEAEKERLDKFVNETKLYIGMLEKGNNHLYDAVAEINAGKDLTAPVLISQGKALFDEVGVRAEEMIEKKTPQEHLGHAQMIMQAHGELVSASRNLVSGVFYINDDENSDILREFMENASTNQEKATQLIGDIKSYLDSLSGQD